MAYDELLNAKGIYVIEERWTIHHEKKDSQKKFNTAFRDQDYWPVMSKFTAEDKSVYSPDVLIVLVVLGDYPHLICNKVNTVETYTKLTNKPHISPISQGLSEVAGA